MKRIIGIINLADGPVFSPVECLALALAGVIFTAAGAVAADSGSTPFALETLVAEALEKNPELKFYQTEILAAKAGRTTAGQWANPELSTSLGHKSVSGPGLGAEGVVWSVSLMQPLEWPGRIGLRKAIANHDIALAELGLERFKAALAARVRALGYGLFVAQEKAAAAAEVAERFKALRDVLVQRDPAGLTPLLETRVIEATELNAQRKVSEAELARQSAQLELNHLLGLPAGDARSISAFVPEFRPLESRAVLVALARTNNFEVRLRAVELLQQGFRVDLARNERYPSISVGPTVSEERAGDRERIVGVGLTVPLPLWNRNAGNVESARARQTQAEASLYVTQRDVERRVVEAALKYETRLREMAKWRPDAVEHFRAAAELADRHYRLGAVPVTTYVELQKQYLEAVESLLDTRKEALEAALELESLSGLATGLVSKEKNP
jgi:cobalt-zinc-cadmium efflux system outer membrane protein